MKRSEMLRHLKGLIRGVHIDDFHKFAESNMSMGRLVSNITETMLSAVEKKGMKPPKKKFTIKGKPITDDESNLISNYPDTKAYKYAWEPEE